MRTPIQLLVLATLSACNLTEGGQSPSDPPDGSLAGCAAIIDSAFEPNDTFETAIQTAVGNQSDQFALLASVCPTNERDFYLVQNPGGGRILEVVATGETDLPGIILFADPASPIATSRAGTMPREVVVSTDFSGPVAVMVSGNATNYRVDIRLK